ncbi:hypothetical protein EDD86DRAFT_202683 [Gorgonomyces haynaldii]|nr:hypothetical protein EDD86DRAFT_202683 [Gorgonomyces haynaldii]
MSSVQSSARPSPTSESPSSPPPTSAPSSPTTAPPRATSSTIFVDSTSVSPPSPRTSSSTTSIIVDVLPPSPVDSPVVNQTPPPAITQAPSPVVVPGPVIVLTSVVVATSDDRRLTSTLFITTTSSITQNAGQPTATTDGQSVSGNASLPLGPIIGGVVGAIALILLGLGFIALKASATRKRNRNKDSTELLKIVEIDSQSPSGNRSTGGRTTELFDGPFHDPYQQPQQMMSQAPATSQGYAVVYGPSQVGSDPAQPAQDYYAPYDRAQQYPYDPQRESVYDYQQPYSENKGYHDDIYKHYDDYYGDTQYQYPEDPYQSKDGPTEYVDKQVMQDPAPVQNAHADNKMDNAHADNKMGNAQDNAFKTEQDKGNTPETFPRSGYVSVPKQVYDQSELNSAIYGTSSEPMRRAHTELAVSDLDGPMSLQDPSNYYHGSSEYEYVDEHGNPVLLEEDQANPK